jgi:hypothetical protein
LLAGVIAATPALWLLCVFVWHLLI